MPVTYSTHVITQHSVFGSQRSTTVTLDVTGTDYLVAFLGAEFANYSNIYYGSSVGSTFTKLAQTGGGDPSPNISVAVFDPNGATTGTVTIYSSVDNGTSHVSFAVVRFSGVSKVTPYSTFSTGGVFYDNSTIVFNAATTNNGMIVYGVWDHVGSTSKSTNQPSAGLTTRHNSTGGDGGASPLNFRILTHASAATETTFASSHIMQNSGGNRSFNIVTLSLSPATVLSAAIAQTILIVG